MALSIRRKILLTSPTQVLAELRTTAKMLYSRQFVAGGRPPIVIIGMHRSGTSIVTRMLEQLGLFVGKKKDMNHEALFFSV